MSGGRLPNKANRVRKPWGCITQRTEWEGERVDRLRTEWHPGVWHSGGLGGDGIGGRGVGWGGHGGWAEVHGRVEERRGNAARLRQEKRVNVTGKVVIVHDSVEPAKWHQLLLVNESKESYTDAKQTESCVSPRHACRCVTWGLSAYHLLLFCSLRFGLFVVRLMCFSFYLLLVRYFLRTSSVRGRCCQTSYFCSLFPVQQTTSGIGHRVK